MTLFLAGFAIATGFRPSTVSEREPLVLDVVPPPDSTLVTTVASIPAAQIALSPDGRHLAFVVTELDGRQALLIRTLASGSLRHLEGTEGAAHPFWARDSQNLAFFATGKVKRIDLAGDCRSSCAMSRTVAAARGTRTATSSLRPTSAGCCAYQLQAVRRNVSRRWTRPEVK